MNLSEDEVHQRLIRLRNLERLYGTARERITFLEQENKQLRERIKELEEKDRSKGAKLDAMAFQLEQIKNKLFGKKSISERIFHKKEKEIRDAFSYQRPAPQHITITKSHLVNECLHCHGKLQDKSVRIFYEEDIPLPIQKIAIKHEVEVGYCALCERQSSGCHIPSKKTVLGDNLKKYVCILSIANRLSRSQIRDHAQDVFDLHISKGEISNILETEANKLRPEYQSLKESVLSQTATHYDETSWKVQKEEQGKFAWVATGTENHDTVFSLGKSRGGGNITDIGVANIGISDDYGAYKKAFHEHQLCWAHPQRKLRDMTESNEFGERKKKRILATYQQFSNLYHKIKKSIGQTLSVDMRTRFQSLFEKLSNPHSLDPTPLAKLKASLRKNTRHYFTFLNHSGIPIDNNKAERALRHLVIKRKTSFGSKTQRGAETTSILASVILSLKWNNPDSWFKSYLALKP